LTGFHLGHVHLRERKATIRWHVIGSGRPLLLLPGLSLPAVSQFLGAATHPALADRRVFMIDYLGSGFSDVPDGHDGTPDSHAADVAAVFDHLGLTRVDLFGHSMGGTVAIALACMRPDLVGRLGAGEANLFPGGGVATKAIAAQARDAWLADGYRALIESLDTEARGGDVHSDALAAGWRQADPAMLHANSVALVNLADDFAERFHALEMPRAFLFGARNLPDKGRPATADSPLPETLEEHGINVHAIPDAGHGMMFDNPDAFARTLAAIFA
jgi:pimeloyl-ACP methyl ester carboxylesterase